MLRVNSLKKQAKSQNSSELLITGIKRVCKMGKGQMVNVLQENIYSWEPLVKCKPRVILTTPWQNLADIFGLASLKAYVG